MVRLPASAKVKYLMILNFRRTRYTEQITLIDNIYLCKIVWEGNIVNSIMVEEYRME